MFLLDTNVVSELRISPRAHSGVQRWSQSKNPAQQFLSVVTLHELEYGILLKRRRDAVDAAKISDWMHHNVIPSFAGRILTVDDSVALEAAALHVPKRRPERDAWIAATARVHGLVVVTRNIRDFVDTGVEIVNPWDF